MENQPPLEITDYEVEFKPYKCNVLDVQSSGLKRHKLIHSKKNPYTLDVCDCACNQSATLKRHELDHGKVKLKWCNVCGL